MIVAVDTGGTKTLVASFNEDGRVAEHFKFPTPKTTDEYVATLRLALREHFLDQKIDAVVIGLPGIVKDGVALWCNNLGWKNFNARDAFAHVLGDAPIFIENDANLAGLAEVRQRETIPELALYLTISTGIGSGIITDGTINAALRYSEAGRTQIEYDGVVREWEEFASGKAIYSTYGKYARDIKSKRTWGQIADRISRGILAVTPVLQPTLIIIGGSIGTYFPQYKEALISRIKEKLPEHIMLPHIIQAKHPEQAVIYGCYYYALDCLSTR